MKQKCAFIKFNLIIFWNNLTNEQSAAIKTEYIIQNDLGGAMIWSIDTDDFHGFCSNGKKKFGIIATIAETLFGKAF